MRTLGNFLLIIVAILLLFIFGLFGFIFTIISFSGDYKYFLDIAIAFDIVGCVVLRGPLNKWFITQEGYKFGGFETISKVLGINKYNSTLKKPGNVVCGILNFVDKNHVEKASGLWEVK